MKNKHGRKMIAPVIITILFVFYYIGFAFFCMWTPHTPILLRIAGAVIPLLLAGVCIYVSIERIKEIRSGEEDDLGKY